MRDTGYDKNGDPTQRRQALMRNLRKRVVIEVDGQPRNVPVFRIVKVEPWKFLPQEMEPIGNDEYEAFEREVINFEMQPNALELWKKAQAISVAENKNIRDEAVSSYVDKTTAEITKGLQSIIKKASEK